MTLLRGKSRAEVRKGTKETDWRIGMKGEKSHFQPQLKKKVGAVELMCKWILLVLYLCGRNDAHQRIQDPPGEVMGLGLGFRLRGKLGRLETSDWKHHRPFFFSFLAFDELVSCDTSTRLLLNLNHNS